MKEERGRAMVPVAKVSGPAEGICRAVLQELQEGKGSSDCTREFGPWNNGLSRGIIQSERGNIPLLLQVVHGFPVNHPKDMRLERGKELRLAEAGGNGCRPGIKYFGGGEAILFLSKEGTPPESVPAYVNKIVKEFILPFYERMQSVSSTPTATESARKHFPPPQERCKNRQLRQPFSVR